MTSGWPMRLLALILFVQLSLLHKLTLGDATGFAYYGGAAATDLIVIFILYRMWPAKFYVLCLQVVCLLFIIANTIGWFVWFMYWPPTYYNLACYALYAASIISIFTRGGNGGHFRINRLHSCVNFNRLQSGVTHIKNKGAL